MKYACETNPGKLRDRNEDACLAIENKYGDVLIMVLDGMGGHNKGDLASSNAKDYISKCFLNHRLFSFSMKRWLKKVLKRTNTILYEISNKEKRYKGMGTTVTLFLIHKNRTLISYIGDSRGYIIKDNQIKQYSIDETYVEFLYEQGKIKKEDMANHPQKNVLTNSLGCYDQVQINIKEIKDEYDYLICCSDGLYNMIDEQTMVDVLNKYSDLNKAAKRMITRANMRGGKDNISVALYRRNDD